MTMTSSITYKTVMGNKRVHYGTFTNDSGDSGGNIDTGLRSCEQLMLQHSGAAAVAAAPSVNETMPCTGSAVTIVTTTGADGWWLAIGY